MLTPELRQGIQAHLEATLSPHRRQHVAGVAATARRLAEAHGVDPDAAELAGWLHDLAREWKPPQLLAEAEKQGLPIGDLERANPMAMLHAKLGASEAKRLFGINDEGVLQAIARHTMGAVGMSPLDQVVFLADAIEPGRGDAPHVVAVRSLAESDLQAACLEALDQTLRYLVSSGQPIHPDAVLARNHQLALQRRRPQEPR